MLFLLAPDRSLKKEDRQGAIMLQKLFGNSQLKNGLKLKLTLGSLN